MRRNRDMIRDTLAELDNQSDTDSTI